MNAFFKSIALTVLLGILSGPAMAQDMPAVPPAPVADDIPAIDDVRNNDGLVFLELFSSESCPFCPAAERNFNDITADSHVIGMTCMVDYFDSGKASLLSRPFCHDQQDIYVHMLKAGSDYTPQMVINGTSQLAGQNLQKVSKAIQAARESGNVPQDIEIRLGTGAGYYDAVLPTIAEGSGKYVLRITMIKQVPDLAILSGAVQQRERSPHNIATSLIEGGIWNGKRTIWSINPPRDNLADGLIVTVQDQTSGKVMAAGEIDLVLEGQSK